MTSNYSLKQLDKQKIKKTFVRITTLSFVEEKPLMTIEGLLTGGSISVNGSSAVRRTLNLTMSISDKSNILDLENNISLNKKIFVEIGIMNIFTSTMENTWMPQGVFIISSSNISRQTNNFSITIQGKDKMAQLDGTVGGVLPASVTFHERYEEVVNSEGKKEYLTTLPTIFQIIQEAVHHYGLENSANIYINDIDLTAKMLLKYNHETPLWISQDLTSIQVSSVQPSTGGWKKYTQGQDVGYLPTAFSYPGELILKAGDTVVTLLDKIAKTLGNHEFFYDVYGHFIFQEKRNNLNSQVINSTLDLFNMNYLPYLDHIDESSFGLQDEEITISYAHNPKYDNIKNDFIVRGSRTTASGTTTEICYHIAIDQKPVLDLVFQYVYKKNGKYQFSTNKADYEDSAVEKISPALTHAQADWREELYRRALLASNTGTNYSFYDVELLAFWRGNYDPSNREWLTKHSGWNPAVKENPKELIYWLDFLESGDLQKYSVTKIGRRTKVISDTKISYLYNLDFDDIMFLNKTQYENDHMEDLTNIAWKDLSNYYSSIGQQWMQITDGYFKYFDTSSTGASAYDKIRELLYQHLVYNTQVTITSIPKYYLEPNKLIQIVDNKSNIKGNFIITQFTVPLTYNGTMSITAVEALNRI